MTPEPTPEPTFEEPWHAQVFALTVALNEAGHLSWPDWAGRFSAVLARHGVNKEMNGGSDYFAAWLETLETVLSDLEMADPARVQTLRDQWEAAYLTTPHGQPVRLPI